MADESLNDGGVQQAADSIAELMKRAPETKLGEADTPAGDTESESGQETREDEPGLDEAAETPSFEPPSGWAADDQEWFKDLPPDRQERLLKREREYRSNESRRHNEHAEAIKSMEDERKAIINERQNYAQNLNFHQSEIERSFKAQGFDKLTPADIANLGTEGHADYNPAKAASYAAHMAALSRMQAEQYQLREKHLRDTRAYIVMEQGKANKRLAEVAPDWFGDDKKASKSYREIGEYLTGEQYKYPAEQIETLHDWRQLDIVRKAMLYDKAQAAKLKAEKENVKPVPRVQRPGVSGKTGVGSESVDAAQATLRKTGTVEAAAAVLAARMNAAKQRPRRRA